MRANQSGKIVDTNKMRDSFSEKELLIVVTLYLIFTLTYSLAVPLWEAPDEPSHYLTARKLSGLPPLAVPPDSGEAGTVWNESYLYSRYQRFQPRFIIRSRPG